MFKSKCVLCLGENNLVCTPSGCEKVRWAANIRQDDVYKRVNSLPEDELFSYHMTNQCYKVYTNKNKVLSIQKKLEASQQLAEKNGIQTNESVSDAQVNTRVTRSKLNSSSANNQKDQRCAICGCAVRNQDKTLLRISETSRADRFYEITRYFKDDVFTRTSHVQNAKDLFAADIYYHKNCMRAYEQSYTKKKASEVDVQERGDIEISNDNEITPLCPSKIEAISRVIEPIIPRLESGEIFQLSKVRDKINESIPSDAQVNNRNIKEYLTENYKDKIEFSIPSNKNKSTLFYSSTTSLDSVIEKLQPENILKESGKLIKQSMEKVKFDLQDKFCDANSLENSWDKTTIPHEVLIILSQIYNFSINDFHRKKEKGIISDKKKEQLSEKKKLKIKSLFQVMYYIFTNGWERTPLQVMNGLAIHYNCRSKSLIDSMNHLGLSISYDEVLRIKNHLALYTLETCSGTIPLPSHFDKTKFTVAAFDNFDHNEATLSGLNPSHDTSSVLFQEKDTNNIFQKPNISSTNIDSRSRTFNKKLVCQELKTFHKPTKKIVLPADMTLNVSVKPDMFEELNNNDLVWILSRMDVSRMHNASDNNKIQTTPTWPAYNSIVSDGNKKTHEAAFMPILASPVTQFATVYTALCNFNDILSHLDQKYLPVACDEGVFRICRHIQLLCPEQFKYLFIMLGDWHMTKVELNCIGLYLRESGVDHVLIETETFGVNVVEQVLSGVHYARSTNGFLLFDEALQRLQWEAFFEQTDVNKYNDELSIIEALQDSFTEKSFPECKSLHKNFIENCERLKKDFEDFKRKRGEESPAFKYGNNITALMQMLRNSIRGDRTGNLKLHVNHVKMLLPIALIFDRINYMHWLPLYYHDISTLEEKRPELYEEFDKKGNFVIRKSLAPFTSVAIDQALEQSINRSQKSSHGILGCTQRKDFVTAWNLNHHEMMATNNLYRTITRVKFENDELKVHHEYSPTITARSEEQVNKIMQYLVSHGNPFRSGCNPLKNFATEELATPEACEALLNIFEHSCEKFDAFWKERILEKTVSISDPIKKVKLPDFKTVQAPKSMKKLSTVKQNKVAHKIIDIAKERNYDLRRLFSFELTRQNDLFKEDGTMKQGKAKSDLITKLEKKFDIENIKDLPILNGFTLVVDVMIYCRKLRFTSMTTFQDFVKGFCECITTFSKRGVVRIDLVFDSYVENSIKMGERQERYAGRAIEQGNIHEEAPTPVQGNLFWGSDKNKTLLQTFIREYVLENGQTIWPGIEIVCSATNEMPSQTNLIENEENLSILHRNDIEEADSRIIIHVYQACSFGVEKLLVLSSDTDVTVILLHYWIIFKSKGLKELWVQAGARTQKRFIPVHVLAEKSGSQLCSVLPALHHLSGADYTSHIVTKLSALEAEPEKYLKSFGRGIEDFQLQSSIENAEKYLVQAYQKNSVCTTFDQLRYHIYHFGRDAVSLLDLPPTSKSIEFHISRALYATYQQINLLEANCSKLDPTQFGYVLEDNNLLPEKVLTLYPPIDELVPNCNCKVCTSKHCICKSRGLPCISFCLCRSQNSCKNPFDNS